MNIRESQARAGGAHDLAPALVTFARSWHALAAIRSLHGRGVRVLAGDEFRLTPGALSSASDGAFTYPNPVADPAGFVEAIESTVHELCGGPPSPTQRPVLLPVQLETFTVAEHRARLDRVVRVSLAPSDLLDQVRDKGWLVDQARAAGVAVPPTWQPHDLDELDGMIDQMAVPCIVKIRSGAGGVGLERVDDRATIRKTVLQLVEEHGLSPTHWPIVQALAPGEDYCVSAFCDQGIEHAMLTYRNVSKLLDSAPGAIRETVAAEPAERSARRLLGHLQWHGLAQLDYLWDGSAEPVLIEINPRCFGGLFQAIASGVDYPWMLYCSATGRPIPPPEKIAVGLRTETPIVGLLATARQLAETQMDLRELEASWATARTQISAGAIGTGLGALWDGLRAGFGGGSDPDAVERLLDANADNVSQLLFTEDPSASLGLLYPLAIAFRYGRVDTDLLMGLPGADAGNGDADPPTSAE